MERIEYFVTGKPGEDEGVLPRLRWPIPPGVAKVYAKAYAARGDLVLVPYCQGQAAVREIVGSGRRVLAVNFDPALSLALQLNLDPPPKRKSDAAIARLGDNLKQGVPLRQYLSDLYGTSCPACSRQTAADYFVWDKDRGTPIAKQLRCPKCGWEGQTLVEEEDKAKLAEVPVRSMHYHYILDRLAPRPQGDALRARLELLLELYTPRNLYALAEITLKIERLYPRGPESRFLKVVLLDCLDRCSSLTPLPSSTARRKGLSRPSRYVERNVWFAFEEAASRFQSVAQKPILGLAESLADFETGAEEWIGFVGEGLVRDIPKLVTPRSLRLIITSPPPLDSAAWSLSYLWGAWLLGAEAAASMRPLLRQRTPDPEWYAGVMTGTFRALTELLRDRGRMVIVMSNQRPSMIEALLLAAARARLAIASLVQQGSDYRLEMTPSFPQPSPRAEVGDSSTAAGIQKLSKVPLGMQIQEMAAEAARKTIRARGEPVTWRTLHAGIHLHLAETGLMRMVLKSESEVPSPLDLISEHVEIGLQESGLQRLSGSAKDEDLWWLSDLPGIEPPLCDRVEEAAYEVLQNALILRSADFYQAVWTRFPGVLTPDASLVEACLRSLGYELTPDHWQLRPEEAPAKRSREHKTIVDQLLYLGQRLGYKTDAQAPYDAIWLEEDQPRAVFVVRWQAALGEALALTTETGVAKPYLVIPGGRAALVSYKLAHNPLWQETVDESGWRFIKYRHVRQLVGQSGVDEYALRTIVGLDPIVEREAMQIPLF